jgi:proteasome lid subunit RPN8/RPN11
MAGAIRIRAEILEELLRHARREPHIECCGLLAGRDGVITGFFPATNSLASPTRYEIAPRELFQIFRDMRAANLTHLGQYHSHLSTENAPSPVDRAGRLSRSGVFHRVAAAGRVKADPRIFDSGWGRGGNRNRCG